MAGTQSSLGYAITNDEGRAEFVYFGSAAGEYTVTATANEIDDESTIEWTVAAPQIVVRNPEANALRRSGGSSLINGIATPGLSTAPIASITVNGIPVDAIDVSGAFFAAVSLLRRIASVLSVRFEGSDLSIRAAIA